MIISSGKKTLGSKMNVSRIWGITLRNVIVLWNCSIFSNEYFIFFSFFLLIVQFFYYFIILILYWILHLYSDWLKILRRNKTLYSIWIEICSISNWLTVVECLPLRTQRTLLSENHMNITHLPLIKKIYLNQAKNRQEILKILSAILYRPSGRFQLNF